MSARRTLPRTVLLLLPLQVVVKGFEAVFPLLLASWFGRSALTDVYYFAWAVFAVGGSLVFSAFQDSAIVPVLTELRLSQPSIVPKVRGALLAYTITGGTALAIAFGSATAAWFSTRYAGPARTIALASIAPFGVYLVAMSVKTFLVAILNTEHRYAAQPVAVGLGTVGTIVTVAVTWSSLSVVAIPVASALGEIIAIAVLVASAFAADISITPTFARPEPVRRIARLVASEVGGGAVTRINPVVDQLMASLTGVVGGGTLLKLSGDIATVPTAMLQATLLPVLLTHMSEHVAAGDLARFRATVRRTLGVVVATMTGAGALLFAVRTYLLRLLLAHGAMDSGAIRQMAHLLPYHLVGLVPFGALLVLARAHIAVQNSRIMISMGVLNAGLNVVLNSAMLHPLGLEGLALATSVTYAAVAAVFALRLHVHLASLEGGSLALIPTPP